MEKLMANCGKCGAELIGSGKFCATCGAPAPQPPRVADVPASTIAGTGTPASISASASQPASAVNPFASTASPSVPGAPGHVPNPFASTATPSVPGSQVQASAYGPPPAASSLANEASSLAASSPAAQSSPHLDANTTMKSGTAAPASLGEKSQVSPLAVSNAISQRNAFKEIDAAVASAQSAQAERVAAAQLASTAHAERPPERTSRPPIELATTTPAAEPVRLPAEVARKKAPGTQLMSNVPLPPLKPTAKAEDAGEPAPPKKPVARTVAMGFNPAKMTPGVNAPAATPGPQASGHAQPSAAAAQNLGGTPPSAAVAPSAMGGAPSNVIGHGHIVQPPANPNPVHPQSVAHAGAAQGAPNPAQPHDPSGAWGNAPAAQSFHHAAYAPTPAHPHPYAQPQPPPQAHVPSGPGGWGWNAPVPAPAAAPGYGYPFSYPPGTRVHVTWSNGQRYPATVNQVSGSQCLVVFPDGQQHWVEMQYLTPG